MKKNITLKLNESFLKKCKHHAVEEGLSLSKWVEHRLADVILGKESLRKAREGALSNLRKGLNLGGKPLSRDEVYER